MDRSKRLISFIQTDLSCFDELHLGFLFVEAVTGVTYENQVGGHACLHAQIEGYVVPICGPFLELQKLFTEQKYGGWCENGIDAIDADHIDQFMTSVNAGALVDRSRLAESREAWIPITYNQETGFLTWSNSD